MSKTVLLLAGTGAMGTYLAPHLADHGYCVDVIARDPEIMPDPRVHYTYTNISSDEQVLEILTAKHYDAIVDFLKYSTPAFEKRHRIYLDHTDHYIFLSTYRIYNGLEVPTKETSPRLLDSSSDEAFLATEPTEYSLYKARKEDVLRSSGYTNFTIVRPAITYSRRRFQLVTLEAPHTVGRARKGKTVVVPKEALSVQGTMSWAGDVARMFRAIIENPASMGETYTLSTGEHHSWAEIAKIYEELIGMKIHAVDMETYLSFFPGQPNARYQLIYDRLFERVMDNSKILALAGLEQSDLSTLRDGLARELAALPANATWDEGVIGERMDAYLASIGRR